jgi:hypothetical protein
MTFARSLLLYPLMAVVFFALDMIWLGVVAKGLGERGCAPEPSVVQKASVLLA